MEVITLRPKTLECFPPLLLLHSGSKLGLILFFFSPRGLDQSPGLRQGFGIVADEGEIDPEFCSSQRHSLMLAGVGVFMLGLMAIGVSFILCFRSQ